MKDCADSSPCRSIRVLGGTACRHLAGEAAHLAPCSSCPPGDGCGAVDLGVFALKFDGVAAAARGAFGDGLRSAGIHALFSPRACQAQDGTCCVVAAGSRRQFEVLSNTAAAPEVSGICRRALEAIDRYNRADFALDYAGGRLDLSRRTAVMGVVNVTPDSFSDGGEFLTADAALGHALELAEAGASLIDVGGESTRPGSARVSAAEETRRIVPVIEVLARRTDIPVCVDTYKPEVARDALAAGARLVNCVVPLHENEAMAEVAARASAPLIVMHMKGQPKTMQDSPAYDDLIGEVYSSLERSARSAVSHGVARANVVVDPGIGFGKTFEHNLQILDRLHEFRTLGMPICVGASRKAFLGAVLGLPRPKDRLAGSLCAAVIAVRGGARRVRVHDVKETVQAVRVADAVAAHCATGS